MGSSKQGLWRDEGVRRVGTVVRTDVLFHYALRPDVDPTPVVQQGLLPLSAVAPDAARSRAELLRDLYQLFAAAVLGPGRDHHTGIFLSPIDFYPVQHDGPAITWVKGCGRFQIPLRAITPTSAVLTWAGPFPRTSVALHLAALERAAQIWSPALICRWFGHDRTRMFLHVPQVVTYQDAIPVSAEQWQPPGSWS
jgi:hypothetical protein